MLTTAGLKGLLKVMTKPPGVGAKLVTTRPRVTTPELEPVMPFALSVAEMVWLPGVCKVTLKTPWPLTRVLLAGKTTPAAVSLLAKLTVPV